MSVTTHDIYQYLITLYISLDVASLRRYLPYEYWDLNALFLEQTIYLEKVENKREELKEIAVLMMLRKSAEAIKEYNNTKSILKDTELTLVNIERAINPRIV